MRYNALELFLINYLGKSSSLVSYIFIGRIQIQLKKAIGRLSYMITVPSCLTDVSVYITNLFGKV